MDKTEQTKLLKLQQTSTSEINKSIESEKASKEDSSRQLMLASDVKFVESWREDKTKVNNFVVT